MKEKRCTVVSIDAWKTDWAPDPLIVIVDALLEEIKDPSKEESSVIENLKKITNSAINQLPTVAGQLLLGVSMNLVEKNTSKEIRNLLEGTINDISKNKTSRLYERL